MVVVVGVTAVWVARKWQRPAAEAAHLHTTRRKSMQRSGEDDGQEKERPGAWQCIVVAVGGCGDVQVALVCVGGGGVEQ